MIMKHSLVTGFSFGSTSGVITTLGLMVGLHSVTPSQWAVLGGILTIAIADAFSDALGIHISEEFENRHTTGEIWLSTISTFIAKFVVALTFSVPILIWPFDQTLTIPVVDTPFPLALVTAILWGLCLISFLSLQMARQQKTKAYPVVCEHLFIVILVIVITHYVGHVVASLGETGP